MMTRVEVAFHAGLKRLFGEAAREMTLSGGADLRSLLAQLCDSRERRERIFDSGGGLRSDVTAFLNGRNVLFLQGLDTVLKNGDKLALFPPVFGG
jgi:molybdopterin synthase sulfur carrier subunit